ncbi:DnaA regulatory inactivator Hda [Legionella sp. CNM-4043-24]|uniref:DnaA regulatory inactivator Hda n=1 Tax=Legionella sp. CNM-4043-24 TaxID=3421646 RepID=UPI00403B33DC
MSINHQLALAIQLNQQATLNDFCWGENTLLQQQLDWSLQGRGEHFIYIWGERGVGKSHLLQGCCQALGTRHASAVYLPLTVLKEWGPDSLEGMDEQQLIALDDIDTIAGDKAWEEALFHLYNRVRDNGSSILIMAGQNAPAHTGIQLADLRSRLAWGLSIQLHELSDELKVQVLQQHARDRGFELADNVALFLINRCSRSMHALYDILDRLDEASLAAQRRITIPFVKTTLAL